MVRGRWGSRPVATAGRVGNCMAEGGGGMAGPGHDPPPLAVKVFARSLRRFGAPSLAGAAIALVVAGLIGLRLLPSDTARVVAGWTLPAVGGWSAALIMISAAALAGRERIAWRLVGGAVGGSPSDREYGRGGCWWRGERCQPGECRTYSTSPCPGWVPHLPAFLRVRGRLFPTGPPRA